MATFDSIVPGVSLVIFMLLPSLTDFLRTRWDMSTAHIDLMIVRINLCFLLGGTSIITAAPNIPLLIFGNYFLAMITFSVGFGIRAPLLAVSSTHIASSLEIRRLYTLMTMTDAFSHLIGEPFVQIIWAFAVRVGGTWLMLPFLVLTVSIVLSHPDKLLILADAIPRCHCIIMVASSDFHRQHVSQ